MVGPGRLLVIAWAFIKVIRMKSVHRRWILAAGLAVATGFVPVLAQTAYPSKPIRIIVPTAPGGGYDVIGRLVAERLGQELGQSIVVENRTGAGTLVGTQFVASAAPDGYTLVVGGLANMALNLGLYKNPQYTAADFTPIGLMASFSYTLVARKELPQNTLKEVITYAQQNPGKLSLATGGAGSGQHVAGVLFKQLAKVDIVEIPYKGAQPAYTDMLGGRVDLFFDNTTTAQPLIEAGRIKPLATSGTRRELSMPQIPTAREAGVDGLEMESWIGIFASAKTPAPVLEKLRAGLAKVTAQPELRQRLEKGGWRMMGMSVSEAETYARSEAEKWTRFLKQAGISGD